MFEITGTRGYVVGIFLSRIPDGDDADRIPDVVAASIKPTIKRKNSKEPIALLTPDHGAHGVFLSTKEFPCALMDNGHLTSDIDAQGNAKPDATPGIWLPVGDYVISLAGHTQDIEFPVRPENTIDNPVDLYQYSSVAPSDDVIMQVVEVPTGGLPNQALAWSTNGLTWYDPPANELTIGTVEEGPASATISGDAPNQVLDLTIPRGLDGPPNSLSIGTVTEGPASANITGQTPNQTLNLSLPKGNTGATPTLASGTVSKVAAGGNPTAAVRRNGTTDQYFLDLGLPTGLDGSPTPYELRGTGMPNGVVTASPGTYYTDTAGTNGAWRWIKKVGTGTTGWEVIQGDTGWRELTPNTFAGLTSCRLIIRRINSSVTVNLFISNATSGFYEPLYRNDRYNGYNMRSDPPLSLKSYEASTRIGFRHVSYGWLYATPFYNNVGGPTDISMHLSSNSPGQVGASLTYLTEDAWPTTLLGTAV